VIRPGLLKIMRGPDGRLAHTTRCSLCGVFWDFNTITLKPTQAKTGAHSTGSGQALSGPPVRCVRVNQSKVIAA
jgi:hypothetical protein